MTKAQKRKLEKERKAEEERARLEEEALRLAEERRVADELAAKRKAEREAYRAAERERLSGEEKVYYPVQMDFRKKRDQLMKGHEKTESWNQYIDCSNEYDITKEADLNLMITLIDELPLSDEAGLNYLLNRLDEAEKVIADLEHYILELRSRGKPVKTYKSFIEAFGALIDQKFEQICNYITQNSENIVKAKLEELSNMEKTKTLKSNEMKPEVQLHYPKSYSQLAFYIMGFENSGIKTKPIAFGEFNVLSDMPRAFFSKKLVMAAKKLRREYFALGSLERDNPHLKLVDGVVDIECIAYLPETRQVKNYQVKRVYGPNDRLDRLTYTALEGTSSYKVYVALPKNLLVVPRDSLEVRYWSNDKWTAEGIGEVLKEYHKELDRTFFAIPLPKMAPVAMMINRFAELPFKAFRIRRTGQKTVLFSLQTQRVELGIEVLPYKVRLVSTSQPKLEELLHKEFKPTELLYELQQLNVLLLNDHAIVPKPKDVITKEPELARSVLRQVSKACLCYHVQNSKWNPMAKSKDCIVKLRENPEYDEDFYEDTPIDWKTIQFKSNSVKLLGVVENSEGFSKKRREGTVSHLNLYTLANEYPDHFEQNYYTESFGDDEVRIITAIEDLLGSMQFFNFVV